MPTEGQLPGTDVREDRIVLHVDMDCFYASCERLREPALQGEPVVVGMGYSEGATVGAVATASYEAREYGVESAQPISQALERLPRRAENPEDPDTGFYRPVDMEFYQEIAADVHEILEELADTVRKVSIDEAYLDVTERTTWEVAEGFGRHVKQRIQREVGVPASVGVAPNMSAAKIASDHDKPDGLTVVPPSDLQSFLADLPIADLHGVGPVSESAFHDIGVETIGELAETDIDTVVDRFGERGRELHRRARGLDDRAVTERGLPKSLSRESSFGEHETDFDAVNEQAKALARAVASRAQRKGALYQTIGVKVVTPPYDVNTRERSLPGPVDEPGLLEETALDLLGEFEGEEIRKVGVRVSNLSFSEEDQADLEAWADAGHVEQGGTDDVDEDPGEASGALDRPKRGQVDLADFDG
ncbi:MAG: DNA polymerase IV [Halodesulfurarchaeum sp.]